MVERVIYTCVGANVAMAAVVLQLGLTTTAVALLCVVGVLIVGDVLRHVAQG